MAPRPAAKGQSSLPSRPAASDIHNYDVDDDPFAESGPDEPQSKKRKDASSLGIEEEVAVAKKPRVPRVKLDEARLLSEMGIPRLRRKTRDLKFKGKGHEFSDTARLLSFYQLWLDDLFPKAKFLDALAMVEKAGHKKYMRMKRIELIEEGKPKSAATADDEDIFGALNETGEREAAIFPAPLAPIFRNSAGGRAKTPAADDDNLFVDAGEDIYGATPKRAKAPAAPANSLFGNGGSAQQNSEAPGDDELDALMAEEEARRTAAPPPQQKSIFGNGNVKAAQDVPDDEDDLDALMAEAEAEAQADVQPKPSAPKSSSARKSNRVFVEEDEEDDLDAMMAEAEAEGQGQARQIAPTSSAATGNAKTQDAPMGNVDEDEEAAMAEMDGLW
ncbi:replication fork protection component Swi3-domain-containing protein [Biscogniauxia sp. FL1348]|nr:replication fork protection component Swi3-domain-containing protein [Biscogniauxia sp. FL1348]